MFYVFRKEDRLLIYSKMTNFNFAQIEYMCESDKQNENNEKN